MRELLSCAVALGIVCSADPAAQYRTLNDRLTVREYRTLDEWQARAAYLREHILAAAGLLPMPAKTHPTIRNNIISSAHGIETLKT